MESEVIPKVLDVLTYCQEVQESVSSILAQIKTVIDLEKSLMAAAKELQKAKLSLDEHFLTMNRRMAAAAMELQKAKLSLDEHFVTMNQPQLKRKRQE